MGCGHKRPKMHRQIDSNKLIFDAQADRLKFDDRLYKSAAGRNAVQKIGCGGWQQ